MLQVQLNHVSNGSYVSWVYHQNINCISLLVLYISESVDSLCRNGVDRPAIYAVLKQKPYNLTTNTLKAYLSAQPSSLSAFMISKTYVVAQKPRRRQLMQKCVVAKLPFIIFV